ncbi:hemolysin family protein [Pararhodospirillum oryzae]|uniref:Hemolysin C n=1 Tax=Pararhodospirillum oryzae TaxID=478448 RepID=A0A512H7E8_9PROT|nr:hemolysin family protein [Pararhodospirillum oryzae]GEO81379.1 hemolysin C [Pararhodospirillum oryzae]
MSPSTAEETSSSGHSGRGFESAERSDSKGGLSSFLRGVFRPRGVEGSPREVLETMVEAREEAGRPIGDNERVLLANILSLDEVTVEDIMVPRADIIGVDAATPMDAVIALFAESGHSRLPVFRDTLDTVLGMVHIKDLVRPSEAMPTRLEEVAREILYASPSARVLDLMRDMRQRRIHMALVVDEYGGIDGLVTIEDLIEQIVGDIEDEYDEDEAPALIELDDGTVEVDARMDLDDFEAQCGRIFTDEEHEEIDTLGGLVFRLAGRVPTRGELIAREGGPVFEVIDADPRRIRRLRLHELPSVAETE